MHPHGPSRSFYWPRVDDICWVPITHILCGVEIPSTATGRQYNLREKDNERVEKLMLTFRAWIYFIVYCICSLISWYVL